MSEPDDCRHEAPNTTPLDYGRQRRNWIRRHWKFLAIFVVAASVLLPCYSHRAALLQRANWIYWSKRAAAHSMPAASVPVLHQSSASGAVEPDYVVLAQPKATTQPVVGYAPVPYRRLLDIDPRLYSYRPDFLGSGALPLVYMGTVYRPDGTPRLMIVTGAGGYRPLEGIRVAVLPVASVFDPPPTPPVNRIRTKHLWSILIGAPSRPLELYSGVLDPLNHSCVVVHFVVADDFEGKQVIVPGKVIGEGDIDVSLQDDDTVRVKVRSFPTGIHTDVFGPSY